ncbi:hypothetical protein E4T56_gene6599 [Termitomyces sp. T112]|nr:hypothetical protein E4T56_gene6599 [Termitomyces sp. T112]
MAPAPANSNTSPANPNVLLVNPQHIPCKPPQLLLSLTRPPSSSDTSPGSGSHQPTTPTTPTTPPKFSNNCGRDPLALTTGHSKAFWALIACADRHGRKFGGVSGVLGNREVAGRCVGIQGTGHDSGMDCIPIRISLWPTL